MSISMDVATLTGDWNLPQEQVRQKLMNLQDACLAEEQVELPVTEYFSEGCYGREIFIPKGTCLVGEIHLDAWITVVSRGKIQVASEEGVSIVDATERPVTFVSPAGMKRAGYALEDTWWVMFIATPHKTTEAIRAHHIVSDYDQLEDRQTCLGQ